MNPSEILALNHDVHMHSQQFSDGWHTISEVLQYALRWQIEPRWVGLSEHSPRLEELYPGEQINPALRQSANQIRAGEHIQGYFSELRPIQEEFLRSHGAIVLAGLELEWRLEGTLATQAALRSLDYVIAAYHDRGFNSAQEAGQFLERVIRHPFSDILAHPDQFLGHFEAQTCNWKSIFNQLATYGGLCEYNLTTPLSEELFAIARDESEVKFVIGSDVHDFRHASTCRIRDAWSESLGGDFETGRAYLNALLEIACPTSQVEELAGLYDSRTKLNALELKIYQRTRRLQPCEVPLSTAETSLVKILDAIPENQLDQDFLIKRLARFSNLPAERIASLLPVVEFTALIQAGRQRRQDPTLV